MKLAFIFIKNHQNVKNLSLPFISDYTYSYSKDTYSLDIEKYDESLEDYYSGINITAIMGKNGVGKTSIMSFIENAFSYTESQGFFVWVISNGKFIIQTVNHHEIKINTKLAIELSYIDFQYPTDFNILKVNNINDFSFKKHSRKKRVVDLTAAKINRSPRLKLKQASNLMNYFKFNADLIEESNFGYEVHFKNFSSTIKSYLTDAIIDHFFYLSDSYSLENMISNIRKHYRNLLPLKEERNLYEQYKIAVTPDDIPDEIKKYIKQISLNTYNSFLVVIQSNCEKAKFPMIELHLKRNIFSILKKLLDNSKLPKYVSSFIVVECIQYLIKNKVVSISGLKQLFDSIPLALEDRLNETNKPNLVPFSKINLEKIKEIESKLIQEISSLSDQLSVLKNYQEFNIQLEPVTLKEKEMALNYLDMNLCTFYDVGSIYRKNYDFKPLLEENKTIIQNAETVNVFMNLYKRLSEHSTSNISHGWVGLSSGQFAKASIFSTIYNYLNEIKFQDEKKSTLILIDEADLYLHPEWQRTFVSDLITLITSINMESSVQIIITSHSPIIIGDFLPEDIIGLRLVDSDIYKIDSTGFGSELNSFYIDGLHIDSTYGEHSRARLQDLFDKKVNKVRYTERDKKLANKIGNMSLKEALLND